MNRIIRTYANKTQANKIIHNFLTIGKMTNEVTDFF